MVLSPYQDGELLTPSAAAAIAGRSVRTIRRAYLAGSLMAYRDAHGRGIRIRYGDLRDWKMSEVVPSSSEAQTGVEPRVIGQDVSKGKSSASSGNLALLSAAREKRRKRASAAG